MKKLLLILLMLPTLSFAEDEDIIDFTTLEDKVAIEYETYMKSQVSYKSSEPHVCEIRLVKVEGYGKTKAYKGIMFTSEEKECDRKENMTAIALDVWERGTKVVWKATKATN